MCDKRKIVAIGGGTGLSILLRGLKVFFAKITAIVNVVDDGGGSGVLREDLAMLPPGDIRSCILALADKEPVLQELFAYRFEEGRLKDQSFGNLMIAAMVGISDNFEDAILKISDIFAIQGKVLPSTNENVHLVAELEDGTIVQGESKIPYQVLKKKSPIKKVFLNPKIVNGHVDAIKRLLEADIILIGPGSLYTSLIPNLLADGIVEAIKKSKAKKIYVANLMTQPGETDGYSVSKHLDAILNHTDKLKFDYVIANNREVSKEVKIRYKKESSELIVIEKEDRKYFNNKGIKIIEGDFIEVKRGYIRHDVLKLVGGLYNTIGKI